MKTGKMTVCIFIAFMAIFIACPTEPPKDCEVTFDSQSGAPISSQTVTEGKKVAGVDDPYTMALPEYYFDGWYTSLAFTDKWDFDTDKVQDDMTLYAHWMAGTTNLSYTYDSGEYSVAAGSADFSSGNCVVPGYHNDGTNGVGPVTGTITNAFLSQSDIINIYLPNTITNLRPGVIGLCSNIVSFTIPKKITLLQTSTCAVNNSLVEVIVPDGVVQINTAAFSQCAILTEINLPGNITTMGTYAVDKCPLLETITITTPAPPTALGDVIQDCPSLTAIRVPAAGVDAYKAATGWSPFADIIVGY